MDVDADELAAKSAKQCRDEKLGTLVALRRYGTDDVATSKAASNRVTGRFTVLAQQNCLANLE